jgi:hypothetical protein
MTELLDCELAGTGVKMNLQVKRNIPSIIALLLIFSLSTAAAADFTGNCDARVITRAECTSWLEQTLTTLGCSNSNKDTRCFNHPWGSDFTKSWICTTPSQDCLLPSQNKCPDGTYRTFLNGIDVCKKSKQTPHGFRGECEHENTSHSAEVKNCSESAEVCAKIGGTPENCFAPTENPSSLAVSCHFPDITLPIQGPRCDEIRSKCDLINTEKGAKGRLLSCLAKPE